LAAIVEKDAAANGYDTGSVDLKHFCTLMQPRVQSYGDFLKEGYYFFEDIRTWDEKLIRKKWSDDKAGHLGSITQALEMVDSFDAGSVSAAVKKYVETNGLGFGQVFPFLRIALSGTTMGPDLFEMMEVMGKKKVCERLKHAIPLFDQFKSGA
jgi:glutamyl-tRNA synthetase